MWLNAYIVLVDLFDEGWATYVPLIVVHYNYGVYNFVTVYTTTKYS